MSSRASGSLGSITGLSVCSSLTEEGKQFKKKDGLRNREVMETEGGQMRMTRKVGHLNVCNNSTAH